MDRNEVLTGLRTCTANVGKPTCPEDCPYLLRCFADDKEIMEELVRDALALLEPRVLTLEEVEKSEVGFLEWKDDDVISALITDIYADDTVGVITPDEDGEYWLQASDYGKTWRCWSERVTDEQRKVVKWDD